MALFPHSHEVLHLLHTDKLWAGTRVAYVSRTDYPEYAAECLDLLSVKTPSGPRLRAVAHHFEIYPGGKVTHFKRIHAESGIAYEDMVCNGCVKGGRERARGERKSGVGLVN